MQSKKKDGPALPVAIIAVALAAAALILTIAREADEVRFVPRDQITTTTIVFNLPEGG
jgi:hypothetical protein